MHGVNRFHFQKITCSFLTTRMHSFFSLFPLPRRRNYDYRHCRESLLHTAVIKTLKRRLFLCRYQPPSFAPSFLPAVRKERRWRLNRSENAWIPTKLSRNWVRLVCMALTRPKPTPSLSLSQARREGRGEDRECAGGRPNLFDRHNLVRLVWMARVEDSSWQARVQGGSGGHAPPPEI